MSDTKTPGVGFDSLASLQRDQRENSEQPQSSADILEQTFTVVEDTLAEARQGCKEALEKSVGADRLRQRIQRLLEERTKANKYTFGISGQMISIDHLSEQRFWAVEAVQEAIDTRINAHYTALRQKEFIADRMVKRLDESLLQDMDADKREEFYDQAKTWELYDSILSQAPHSIYVKAKGLDNKQLRSLTGEVLRRDILSSLVMEETSSRSVGTYGDNNWRVKDLLMKYAVLLLKTDAFNQEGILEVNDRDKDTITVSKALETINEHDPEFFTDIQTLIKSYPYTKISFPYSLAEQYAFPGQSTSNVGEIPYRPGKRTEDIAAIRKNLESIQEPFDAETFQADILNAQLRITTVEAGVAAVKRVQGFAREKIGNMRRELEQAQQRERGAQERINTAETQARELAALVSTAQQENAQLRQTIDATQAQNEAALQSERRRAELAEAKIQALLTQLEGLPSGIFGGIKPDALRKIIAEYKTK